MAGHPLMGVDIFTPGEHIDMHDNSWCSAL